MACNKLPVLADSCRKHETCKTSGEQIYLNQILTEGNLSNPVYGGIEYEEMQVKTVDKPPQLPVLLKNSKVRRRRINLVYVLFGLTVALFLAIIGICVVLALKLPKEKEWTDNVDVSSYLQQFREKETLMDSGWGIWSSWGRCSTTCDSGISTRLRFCILSSTAINGRKDCEGDIRDYKACYERQCSVTNGQWSSWSSWSSCLSSTCMKSRNRTCDNPLPSAHGLMCPGNSVDKENCDLPACTLPMLQARLRNGTRTSGKLEVSLDGRTWGNVCADKFDTNGARVACRMLGFSGSLNKSDVVKESSARDKSLPIFLDDLKCFGTEASLLFCGHAGWGKGDCGERKYVGVSCT